MSKIFRTPSSSKNELKVFGYNKIFSNKQIYTFNLFCLCIRCVFSAHRTPEKPQSNVCSTTLIIQSHKTMTESL